jgi:hypothetical protein
VTGPLRERLYSTVYSPKPPNLGEQPMDAFAGVADDVSVRLGNQDCLCAENIGRRGPIWSKLQAKERWYGSNRRRG